MTKELVDFHTQHHEKFHEFSNEKSSFYAPDKWIPHLTIASRLYEESMVKAFLLCRKNSKHIDSYLSKIALLEIEVNENNIAVEERIIGSIDLL